MILKVFVMCKRLLCFIIFTLLLSTAKIYAKSSYPVMVESNTQVLLSTIESRAKLDHVDRQPIGKVISWVALQLVGSQYVPALLDRESYEYLYIGLNQTDCMLFIEEVLAVSNMLKNKNVGIDALSKYIYQFRYHGNLSYCNRNHYFKDWSLVNENKGFVIDEAAKLTGIYLPYKANVLSSRLVKINKHTNDISCIQARESFIDQQKLGFIPLSELPKYLSDIHNGDIIGIIRTPNGHADSVHHLGIAYVHDKQVSMIDASSDSKKVVIEPTLTGYLAKWKNSEGIVLLRPISR